MTRTTNALEYSAFLALRQTILSEAPPRLLEQPLATWAHPNDRALPLVHLGRPLRKLLSTPFEALCDAPGIGPKKITCFLELLRRVASPYERGPAKAVHSDSRNSDSNDIGGWQSPEESASHTLTAETWDTWRSTVTRYGLGDRNLGQFARSLQDLPSRVWDLRIETFAQLSLDEVYKLHAFGEKRIHALFDIFAALYDVLTPLEPPHHLTVVLIPPLAARLSAWTATVLKTPDMPTAEELREAFVQPIVGQIAVDAGSQLAAMANSHLGLFDSVHVNYREVDRPSTTPGTYYRRRMAAIVRARWPEGKREIHTLLSRRQSEGQQTSACDFFHRAVELFFPLTTQSKSWCAHRPQLVDSVLTPGTNPEGACASC